MYKILCYYTKKSGISQPSREEEMNRHDGLNQDQKDVYYEIVRTDDPFEQFEKWLNLNSTDAKQILAALPLELAKSVRFYLTMIYKNGDYEQLLSSAYTGQPSKIDYTLRRVKKFWMEKVIVLTKEDELEYNVLNSRI